ncbi:MAG: S46 family peptidase [Gemmatimonadales bacterium]
MTIARLASLVSLALAAAACTPAKTVTTTPAPAARPAAAPVALQPVGYRSEFGTMWTFDAPPLEYWKKTYGFSPDQAWLDKVRLASVRLPNCSASFVSAKGLVITNHHCVRGCAEEVSPKDTNYIETGFAARSVREEKKCPGLYVDQLESIENVTERVRAAVTAPTPAAAATQRTAIIATIQNECNQRTGLTCQVVSLYQGGIYSLYRYRRYDDLRLVFAPEEEIAAFGGDPDNFTYPRYDLDAGMLRAYVNDKPHTPQNYFRWSRSGAADGEAIFVVGNPGSTGRLNTMAQMEFLRDVGYPAQLGGYQRTLGIYRELMRTDSTAARRYQNNVFGLENSFKAVTGYRTGLVDSSYMAAKAAFEREFRARLAADPKLAAEYGGTYDAIAAAQRELASFDAERRYRSFGPSVPAGGSRLLNMAGQLVRIGRESALPDSQRLAAYRGNLSNSIRASLLRAQPIDTAFERLAIAAQLRAAKAELPADDPLLRAALAGRTPEQAAAALVSGTRVGDVAFRKSLVEGGEAAVAASNDPLITLARQIDVLNREVVSHSDRLNAVIVANTERIGRALFQTYGTALPPDATFSLRISDGIVQGYPMNGTIAPYKTTFFGMYARSADFDGKPPFALTKKWIDRRGRLDLTTPYNFVSTNDITGGNSGSPVINRNAEIVGVAFDSNIEGVANRFLFDTKVQRTVNVHSSSILEALRKVYDAGWIADELQGK